MTENAVTTLSAGDMLRGLNTVRGVLAPDLSDEELRLFAMVANRSGLDPFAKQIYAVKRKGRVTFQTGIDGYRSIAARTGLYDGQDEPTYGPDCDCVNNPKPHPEFATVRVYRKDVSRAIAATAYWHEYVPAAGQSGEGDVMWRRMPHVMVAKVAEALALRKAFPYDPENRQGIGADVYTADEMAQAERVPEEPRPSARERITARAAEVEILAGPMDPEASAGIVNLEEVAEGARVIRTRDRLTAEEFTEAARHGNVLRGAVAKAIGCTAAELDARVAAMTDIERGILADELNLDWRLS